MAICAETWTPPRDFRLRRMQREGASWEMIAEALALSPAGVEERARRIGAIGGVVRRVEPDDPAREPLPPGDPRAWSVLTAGTWLAGTRYPQPDAWGPAQ